MNLFVGNLNPETTAASLRTLFSEFGEVVASKVIIDNATGMSRGFGFVEMADKFHSYDAIDNIDSIFFEGNVISVKEAKQNNTKDGKSGGSFGRKPAFGKPSFGKPAYNKPAFKPRTTYTYTPRPIDNSEPDSFNRL
jgi:RNA recognition motif-containing protein